MQIRDRFLSSLNVTNIGVRETAGRQENSWTLRVRVVMVVMVKPASLCRG